MITLVKQAAGIRNTDEICLKVVTSERFIGSGSELGCDDSSRTTAQNWRMAEFV